MAYAPNIPPSPSQQTSNAFLPSVFRDPYLQGINAATQSANWSAQSIPGAAQFQQQLYNPNLNQFEQQSLGAQSWLANQALGQTQAKLAGMFENAPNSGLAPAMLQAANQSAMGLQQNAAQMALQRQQLATQTLPFTFGFPIQATQAAQQSSQGLLGNAMTAMYGDSSYPLAALGSNPFVSPTVIAQQPSSGSGKGK